MQTKDKRSPATIAANLRHTLKLAAYKITSINTAGVESRKRDSIFSLYTKFLRKMKKANRKGYEFCFNML